MINYSPHTNGELREAFDNEFPAKEYSLHFKTRIRQLFNQAVEEVAQKLLVERMERKLKPKSPDYLMQVRAAKMQRLLK